jgi:hypothetical protein
MSYQSEGGRGTGKCHQMTQGGLIVWRIIWMANNHLVFLWCEVFFPISANLETIFPWLSIKMTCWIAMLIKWRCHDILDEIAFMSYGLRSKLCTYIERLFSHIFFVDEVFWFVLHWCQNYLFIAIYLNCA